VSKRYLVVLLLSGSALAAHADTAIKPGHAAIASAHKLATAAGFETLAAGGNAFDAAVTVAATLSVVEPQSSGIGGGGLFLLHRVGDGKKDKDVNDKDVMVDARETAPAAVDAKQYLDAKGELDQDKAWNGPLAAAIPGEVAGMVWVSQHYGKLPLSTTLAPAIRIARDGFQPDARCLGELAQRTDVIKRYPAAAALLLENGVAPKVGWTLKNPDLAHTLELIAAKGDDGFYRGEIAQKLVDGVKAAGGDWSLKDLDSYRAKEREPLAIDYRGWHIVTASPPSSGGIVLAEMLNILSGYDLTKYDSAQRIHFTVEAMRLAYRDRAEYLGDPDYVKMPIERLTGQAYAAKLRRSIQADKATPSSALPGYLNPHESPHTSHFSIIDADGNMAGVTQTVNLPFGNGMVVAGTGFMLNDEMDDFALKAGAPNAFGLVGNDANAPKAGHRPLSSMTPSFVIGADRVGVIGTPGGSRIITMVLEGILSFIDGELPAQIVAKPRFHHQYLPDVISAEPHAFTVGDTKALEKMGYVVNEGERTWGFMNVVSWDRKSGKMYAASDPRRPIGSGEVK
jgi:gamma-glutamyltranspeptidase / glutathione hydrolase